MPAARGGMEERGWDAGRRGRGRRATCSGTDCPTRCAVLEFACRRGRAAAGPDDGRDRPRPAALDGGYVPAGPSGSPTRGLVNVLPTGRNFYSVDPKAIPSRLAWEVGQALADSLVPRYLTDTGETRSRSA